MFSPTPQKTFYPPKIYMQRPYIPRCGIFLLKLWGRASPFEYHEPYNLNFFFTYTAVRAIFSGARGEPPDAGEVSIFFGISHIVVEWENSVS